MAAGEVIGKADSFNVFVRAHGDELRRGDFVAIQHSEAGLVLGVVRNLFKEASKADGKIQTTAQVMVIGSRDGRGVLRPPRTALSPGELVWKADSQFISHTLGLQANAEKGLFIGCVDGYPNLPVHLDVEKLLTKHLAVLAVSGSGKSYCVGVILEEMLEKNIPVVILDPHGEYASLRYENDDERERLMMERFGITPKGYFGVREYTIGAGVDKLTLSDTSLKSKEIAAMLGSKLNNAQLGSLYEAIRKARDAKAAYSLADVLSALESLEGNVKWPVVAALEELITGGVLSQNPTPIPELVKPGQAAIINLKGAGEDVQQIVVTRLLGELFSERKHGRVPPFFLVVEEAHNFAPERSFGEAPSSAVMRTIAAEGRKFGLGLCVVTQRPARIDKNVLSQCNTQIVLRMRNPNDLRAIGASLERFDALMGEELKSLPVGTAIASGEAAEVNLTVEIRPRRSKHGGKAQASAQAPSFLIDGKAVGETVAKLMLGKEELERAGVTVHSLLYHPFWVLSTPNGDLLLDAVYAKFCEQKLNEIITFKPLAELQKLDSTELKFLAKVLRKGEVFSSESANVARELGLDKKIIESACESLCKEGWLASHNLGAIRAFTPAFGLKRIKVIEDAATPDKQLKPETALAVPRKDVLAIAEMLPAFVNARLLHLPVYVSTDAQGNAKVIRAYA
ncbi:MAG: ATP-binding protein [Candidatus Micrarchaeota archaeon]